MTAAATGAPRPAIDEIARLIDDGWLAEALSRLAPLVADGSPLLHDACHQLARAALATGDGRKASSLLALAEQGAHPRLAIRIRQTRADSLRLQRRFPEAEAQLRGVVQRARSGDPSTAARALVGIAEILIDRGAGAEAFDRLRMAAKLDPENSAAFVAMAELLVRAGDGPGALGALNRALRPQLGDAALLCRIGHLFDELGGAKQAEAACRLALQINPRAASAYNTLGLLSRDRPGEAAAHFQKAVEIDPGFVQARNNLGLTYHERGMIAEAAAEYGRVLERAPDFDNARSNLLMVRHYDERSDKATMLDEARRLMRAVERPAPRAWSNAPRADRRLRIGYVSGDLRSHPVGYFLENVLRNHDAQAVEVFCYATALLSDSVTERLRAAAHHWRSLVGRSDDAAASLIAADGIDVLVDLSGHTARNRLGVFARKPAPVQATWLGYFGTTGLAAIDYIIADRFVVPPEHEKFYTEAPYRLPHSYLCFTPPEPSPEVASLPAMTHGGVTFGSFNNLAKVNDSVAALWARVLDTVPGSRLLLKTRQLGDAEVQARTAALFARHGVGADRLVLELPGQRLDMLAAYGAVDIALDPFPFGGGTTTAEALFMGVPVVSRRGDRFVGRVSESILTAVGLGELVAETDDVYLERAVALARDPRALAALRAGLRARMLASPFCRADLFTRDLETAFRDMWSAWCRKQDIAA